MRMVLIFLESVSLSLFLLVLKISHGPLFPSGSASEFPFPMIGTQTTFTSFFSNVLYKQGKEIITCEYWTHGTPGACFGSRIFFFLNSRNEEGEADLSLRAAGCGGYPHGTESCFESRPWEAATGNAERNKSVRLVFLSVLQWSCFCFLPPPFGWKLNFLATDMSSLTRNAERVAGGSHRECKLSTFWLKDLLFSNHTGEGKFRLSQYTVFLFNFLASYIIKA